MLEVTAQFPALVSERIIVTVETSDERRKIFQVLFAKGDGSMFVNFPYYNDCCGLLTLVTLRAKNRTPAFISLLDHGKVTGHRVKYSHHPDGAVHFSQAGKIVTSVRKSSVPLERSDGHIFTVQFQGIRDFSPLSESEKAPLLSTKKSILNFRFEGQSPGAIKFVGHWYTESSLSQRITRTGTRLWFTCERQNGTRVLGMLVANPFLASHETQYLLLTCEAIPLLDRDRYSTLLFIGGFDEKETAMNPDTDTQFLALSYPASQTYDELVRQIGTVDFVPGANVQPANPSETG
jgi:hypothetical protein